MDFSKQYTKAEDAYKKRNFDYAVEIYLSILKMDPNQVKARASLRAILIKKKEEGSYKPAGKLSAIGFVSKLKTLQFKKNWDQVIAECDRHLTVDMDNASVLKALGTALMHLNHSDAAVNALETVRQITPKDAEIYKMLGKIFVDTGELEKAKKFWEVASQLDPTDADAVRSVRDISAKITSKVWEGGDDYRSRLRDEKFSKVLEDQAHVIRTDEDIVNALASIDELIVGEPDAHKLGKLWRKKAELLERRRDYGAARLAYEKHLELTPDSYDAPDKIGDLLLKSLEERLESARVSKDNDEVERVTIERDRAQIAEYRRRVKAHPTEMKHRFDLGRAMLKAGDMDGAIEALQQSVADGKLKVNSLLLLAQAFSRKGMYDFAVGQCERALETTEGRKNDIWKATIYTLGDVYERAADLPHALKHFEQLYLVDISYRDVSKRYDAIRAKLGAPGSASA